MFSGLNAMVFLGLLYSVDGMYWRIVRSCVGEVLSGGQLAFCGVNILYNALRRYFEQA